MIDHPIIPRPFIDTDDRPTRPMPHGNPMEFDDEFDED